MPDTTLGWRTILHRLGIEQILVATGADFRTDTDFAGADEHAFFEVDSPIYPAHLTLFISVHQDGTDATVDWPTIELGIREREWGEPVYPTALTYTGGSSLALVIVREAVTRWVREGLL